MSDPFDLQRFVDAQAGTFDQALAEVAAGAKRSHWMWFVFPRLKGLGMSATAQHYGIAGLEEARAYLAHPVLGPRYRAVVAALNAVEGRTAHQIFGSPDDLKLRSSLTLFAETADDPAFREALARYYGGVADAATLRMLS